MIWVNETLVPYEKAINALNYDKLGHETGLGSWGVIFDIKDGSKKPLTVYLGAKFDVISIITNRFVSSFINIPKKLKDLIPKIKQNSMLDNSVKGTSSFKPDIKADTVIEFFVDIYKISIDVVEFLNTIYQYQDDTEEYAALDRDVVFLSGGRRASRGISATMLRTYDGNLENFGFIFSRKRVEFVLNELIIDVSLVHDEIKYTFWLTPHDREEYKFFKNGGNIPAEKGSPFIDGLGVEKVISAETAKLYQYDRRGFRQGYYDVTVENPIVNAGYFDGNIEATDTFQFAYNTLTRVHKHKAQIPLDCRFRQHIGEVVAPLLSSNIGPERITTIKQLFDSLVKAAYVDIFKQQPTGSFIEKFNNTLSDTHMESVIKSLSHVIPNIPVQSILESINRGINTCVVPFFILNKLKNLKNINIDEIQNAILFIYHPIIDKFVFYEMGPNDPAEITDSSILFYSDGTQYGIDFRGPYPVFVWSNFQKRFRENISSWINLKGEMVAKKKKPSYNENSIDSMPSAIDSGIPVYDDLTFQGNCAKIIAINKEDVRDIVRKTQGEVQGEFVFGLKTGDIEVIRDGLWM